MERKRGTNGKFTLKGEEVRKTRTVRLTDSAWAQLQKAAAEKNKTKSDVLEDALTDSNSPCITRVYEVIKILEEELKPRGFSANGKPSKEVIINRKLVEEVTQNLREFVSEATA